MRDVITIWSSDNTSHRFFVYRLNEDLPERGGVYIYVGDPDKNDKVAVVYIGQTNNLQRRKTEEAEDKCIRGKDTTAVAIKLMENEQSRKTLEKRLIKYNEPMCNEQYT